MRPDAMLPYRSLGAAAPQDQNTFVEGTVVAITAKGMTFRVKDWDGGKHVFGPAPWPMSRVESASDGDPSHDHAETKPAAGWRCLILFLGEGISNPWVIGVWPA